MEQSYAEARACDARLEENIERKIQEAVEAERKSARALSEERRWVYNENLERAMRFEFREEVKQLKAAAEESLVEVKQLKAAAVEGPAETRGAVSNSHEMTAARGTGGASLPQGPPLL